MSRHSQPNRSQLITILIVATACVLIGWLAQSQSWAAPMKSLAFTLPLVVAVGLIVNAKKRSRQLRDRSRSEDSIERRASERASERTVELALLILAIQAAALTFWFPLPGSLIGFGTLAAVIITHWVNYAWQLRQATKEAS